MDHRIQPWKPADRDAVVELILPIQRDEFGIAITLDDQPDLIDVDGFYRVTGGEFWVAHRDDEVVGTIAAIAIDENTIAVRKMFVRVDQRGGTGLAASLMDTLVEWARGRGVRTILLGTTEVMAGAHRFYGKHDFVPIAADDLPDAFPRMAVDSRFFRRDLTEVRRP